MNTDDTDKNNPGTRSHLWQPIVLLALLVIGVALHFTEILNWQKILVWAQGHAQYWWVPISLILLQALLFTFALPGSAILWVVAPIYPPVIATIILTTGSTIGALSANLFARRGTSAWTEGVRNSHLFQVLKRRGDFLNLCAIRLFPAFPHSVLNYGAGMLRLPLTRFLLSSLIGLASKSFLYSNAIHGAISSANLAELVQLKTLAPLFVLALLAVIGSYFQHRWLRHRK